MPSLTLTVRWGGEEEDVVECVAQLDNGAQAATKIAGRHVVEARGAGPCRETSDGGKRKPRRSVEYVVGEYTIKNDEWGISATRRNIGARLRGLVGFEGRLVSA